MASIQTKGKQVYVVYRYVDGFGREKQKWEPVKNKTIANKRKAEIENERYQGTFISPDSINVEDFIQKFVILYGRKKWNATTMAKNRQLIRNYINPSIGAVKIQDITTFVVDEYYSTLEKTPSIKDRKIKVSASTIKSINKLLKCAFNMAKKWELVKKNPFENATLPNHKYKERQALSPEEIMVLLNDCSDPKLSIAINLSFACTLRLGEILGLQWSKVFISDEHILQDDAHVIIDQQLQRENTEDLEELNYKDVSFVFPHVVAGNHTSVLVLKTTKSDSDRKVWIPRTLAQLLREWKKNQDELKKLFGGEYSDYDLVICLENGRPCAQEVIGSAWRKLRAAHNISDDVVFHCFRHSSITQKLKLNHGDIKATQGDSGHSQADMITKVYAHIRDDDRRITAKKFDADFYNPSVDDNNIKDVLAKLISSPDVKDLVARLLED